MNSSRNDTLHMSLMALEAAAVSARGGFGCMFSSSDEYESALISERRAQPLRLAGRNWPAGVAAIVVAGGFAPGHLPGPAFFPTRDG